MRWIERLVKGRKSWSEPPFWTLDALRNPWLAASSSLNNEERIDTDFEGYATQAYKDNGVIFACMLVRQLLFSEARFQWRSFTKGRPGDLFGSPELALLETPWPGGTTGELLARMESDVSLAGNFYATTADDKGRFGRQATGPGRRVVRMRPDWVTIVTGTNSETENPRALDAKIVAYVYNPPPVGSSSGFAEDDMVTLLPSEVCHYSPIPDPVAQWRGMSWLTPILREIEADKAATIHKGKFFRNGATPNMSIVLDKDISVDTFDKFKLRFEQQHKGVENAYKTLFLGGGADVKPLSMDFKQLEFKATQGAGETRVAAASGVPALIVGLSEGLQSATYSNYGQARRRLADGTMRPLWRTASASLQSLVTSPNGGAALWYDDRNIPFLREDTKDAAEIAAQKAATIATLVNAGFEATSVIAAVEAEDYRLLKHSGLTSVQLQPPATAETEQDTDEPPVLPPGEETE